MMLNGKISEMLNRQLNAELQSAYLYLAFEGYFDHINLGGFANWYKVQALEEIDHAMIFYRYLAEQGENITFDAIGAVSAEEMGMLDVLKEAKKHEQLVTDMINRIYGEAHDLKDWRTMKLLDWFIKEQAEEEKNADEMVQKYLLFGLCDSCPDCSQELGGNDFGLCGGGLYSLNSELAARVHTVPEYPLA